MKQLNYNPKGISYNFQRKLIFPSFLQTLRYKIIHFDELENSHKILILLQFITKNVRQLIYFQKFITKACYTQIVFFKHCDSKYIFDLQSFIYVSKMKISYNQISTNGLRILIIIYIKNRNKTIRPIGGYQYLQ